MLFGALSHSSLQTTYFWAPGIQCSYFKHMFPLNPHVRLGQKDEVFENCFQNVPHIRHRAARHARACLIPLSGVPMFWLFSFRDPQPPGRFSLRSVFRLIFASFLTNPLYNNDWYQKVSTWEPQNSPKSQTSKKNHDQNAPTVKTCKKSLPGKGQTSKSDDSYTLAAVFSKAKGSQEVMKMGAKMEPQGTQNHKKSKKNVLVGFWSKKNTPRNPRSLQHQGSSD